MLFRSKLDAKDDAKYLKEWFGPIASVVGGGLGTVLVVLSVMLRWPSVLRLGRLQAAAVELHEDERGIAAPGVFAQARELMSDGNEVSRRSVPARPPGAS